MTHVNSTIGSTFTRTSTSLTSRSTQSSISKLQEQLLRLQKQISTGQRILNVSDDPVGGGIIQSMRVRLTKINHFRKNLETIDSHLSLANSSINSIKDIAGQAKGIANSLLGNTNQLSANELAQQLQQMLEQVNTLSNTQFGDTFLFAGSFLERKPFELGTDYVLFTGRSTTLTLPIDKGSSLNLTGSPADAFNVLSGVIKGETASGAEVDLDPALASASHVDSLNDGNGISKGTLKITTSASVEISLSGVENIGDIIALINRKGASIGVRASINSTKDGLLVSSAAGSISITDLDNGKTAKKLGIFRETAAASPVIGSDINPDITIHTQLKDLNKGSGINYNGFTITNTTASETFQGTITVASTTTIGGLIEKINSSDAFVFAQLNDDKTGVDIYSKISGGRLVVTEANASGTTANSLGILYAPATVGRVKLKDINAGYGLTTKEGEDIKIIKKNGQTVLIDVDDATTVRDLVKLIDSDPDLIASATTGGSIRISDATAGVGTLKIENLEGSLAATELGIAASATGAGTLTISSTPLNFVGVEVENIFTAMIKMKRAAQTEDTDLTRVSSNLLDDSINDMVTAAAKMGFSLATAEILRDKFDNEELRLLERKQQIEEIDIAKVLTEFQQTQVVFQASLATTAAILQLNLFRFL